MKKGLRYLRFSSDGQSLHSIERQDVITSQWARSLGVGIIDTFIDEGHSAKTFDRPDIKVLFEFIKKNHRGIDYLIVSELTRFSRDTGDAINMVKKIQALYDIRIVSAGRGAIYDCMDHNSFFIMGLEFLMGNSENIKRQNDTNWGIYTAKAIKGLYIHGGPAPFGFVKEGKGEERRLVVLEHEARIIRFIYQSYLDEVPVYLIRKQANQMGMKLKGNSVVERLLTNPIYYGFQYVKPWKNNPGGIYPLKNVEAIIDPITWNRVKDRISGPTKVRKIIDDEIPLRGVLHCHCGKLLTGAASRGQMGKYYYYYKCPVTSSHNNLSAIKAHKQLSGALKLMSMPERLIKEIREASHKELESTLKDHKLLLKNLNLEYDSASSKLESIEEKWVMDKIQHDTYQKWHTDLTNQKLVLKEKIKRLSHNEDETFSLLENELNYLSDLDSLYQGIDTVDKQGLINEAFDRNLYYKNGVYRTPFMLDFLNRNELKMKEMNYLIVEKKRDYFSIIPSGDPAKNRTWI